MRRDMASPVQHLMALVSQRVADQHEEQREGAQRAAHDYTFRRYADSLQGVLFEDDWTGHPAVPANRLRPAASAYLGEGLWFVHCASPKGDDGEFDELRLLVPCSCQRGYLDLLLDGEEDLLDSIALIVSHQMHMPHDHADDCASLPDERPATV